MKSAKTTLACTKLEKLRRLILKHPKILSKILANDIRPAYLAPLYHQKYTAMSPSTLQFKSLFELWQFKTNVHAPHIDVDTGKRLLTTQLSHKDIQLACTGFAAKLIA